MINLNLYFDFYIFPTNLIFSSQWLLQFAAVHLFSFYHDLLLYYAIKATIINNG